VTRTITLQNTDFNSWAIFADAVIF